MMAALPLPSTHLGTIAAASLAALLLLLLLLVVYRRWFHPLSYFPGPFIASVSGLYQTYWNFRSDFALNFARLHEEYGPVVRYSPNGVIFNDHELLSVAYGRRADKSEFFAANFDTEATFNVKNYERHVANKKMIAAAYSDPNLRLFEPAMDELLSRWLHLLEKGTIQDGSVNLSERSGWLASDSVCLLISGKPLGFIESETDVNHLLRNKDHCFLWINFLAIQDNFSWYVRNTWLGRRWLMARPTDKDGVGVFMRERDRLMAAVHRPDGHLDKSALVDGTLLKSLLTAHHDGAGMNMTDIRAEVLFALLAGSSVTPMALWTTVFLIARDAAVQKRLGEELRRAEGKGKILGRHTGQVVSAEAARAVAYLEACVQEALRFAPTLSQLPRLSPRGTGLTLYGRYVAPGLSVSTSPWVIGRSEALFGPDADVFRPARWLEAGPERVRAWGRGSFHFGYGGRKCAARRFAMAQLYKATAEIFRRFHVEPVGSVEGTAAGKPTTKMFRFVPKKEDGLDL